ncbi:MAG: tRNA-uridine aminocarboxypropyltransferase [Bacillota bacterium]|nr:tRNA-uridine aminocarboxypropyltransferase [Bacillota bacterium]
MDYEYKVKQISSSYESCNVCGLSVINCICGKVSKVKTRSMIWILSTEREFHRPSNTARILKLVNPVSTEIFLWERTKEPKKLIDNINDERYETYLLFPVEAEMQEGNKAEHKRAGKIPAYIIIDGTWKEARKILRKSDYLNKLPTISLQPGFNSQYALRRGIEEGNLCTIEAAIEVLKRENEIEDSICIKSAFDLFMKSYKASTCGHILKD